MWPPALARVWISRFILLISRVLQLVRPQRLAEAAAVGLLPLRIELFRSNEFYPARVLLSLHNMHLCRHSLNFAHVPVVDAGHLPIVPGNRDRIPTRFGDNAAISGICPPPSDNIHGCERFESSITGIRSEGVVPARLAGKSNPSKLYRGLFDKCGAGLDLRGASGA